MREIWRCAEIYIGRVNTVKERKKSKNFSHTLKRSQTSVVVGETVLKEEVFLLSTFLILKVLQLAQSRNRKKRPQDRRRGFRTLQPQPRAVLLPYVCVVDTISVVNAPNNILRLSISFPPFL